MNVKIDIRTGVLFIVFVVLGVYYPTIFSPLNSVDDPGMYSYLLNTDDFDFRNIFFPSASGNYYRPILIVSYMMDKYVWGLEESFMHLENMFFHLFNTLLVFAIARRAALLQNVRSCSVPLVASFFFAVHPINTEVVNWIAGRTDLLAGFFLFLSVLLLLGNSTNILMTVLAALSMLVGCLAKETAIFFLPAAMLIPFFLPSNGQLQSSVGTVFRKNLLHFLIFTVAGTTYFAFRTMGFKRGDVGVTNVITHVAGEQSMAVLNSLRLVLKSAGFYLKKLFIPFPLNFGIMHVSDFYIPVGIILVVLIFLLLTRRTISAYFIICGTSVGSSALMIPLIKQTWTPLAERYMYIPSAFVVLGMTFAVYNWEKRTEYQRLIAGVLCIVAVIAIYGTAARTLLWQDNLALFQDTQRKSPDFIPAQNEIANALYARGNMKEASELLLSMKISEELINPQYGWISKSAASVNRGDLVGARSFLTQALETPGKHEVEISLRLLKLYDLEVNAGISDDSKLYPDRVRLLSRLHAITGDPFYQYRLGQAYMHQNELKLAQTAFSSAAAHAPENAYYRSPAQKLSEKLKTGIARHSDVGKKLTNVK